MTAIPWLEVLLFMLGMELCALYGLTVSGHFPAEFRAEALKQRAGTAVLWGTIVVAAIAALSILTIAWMVLPWYAIAIGGGAMLLATPLLLRPFPDWFVNGPVSLLAFAAGAAVVALVMWAAA